MLRHGSLFSGVGGFDLAASWMGWENVFQCELDPFCRKVLQYYWPKTKVYEDIKNFSATQYRGCIDIISGGFPCQPFSQVGRRTGKKDDRYLWPETYRVIRDVRPRWIILENVTGLFSILEPDAISEMEMQAIELFCQDEKQETNSTIIKVQKRIIGTIISEIGSIGYLLPRLKDGTPIVLCVPACSIGAPHRRDRVWFIAHTSRDGEGNRPTNDKTSDGKQALSQQSDGQRGKQPGDTFRFCNLPIGNSENADFSEERSGRFESEKCPGQSSVYGKIIQTSEVVNQAERTRNGEQLILGSNLKIPNWNEWPTQSPLCSRNDGIPREMDGITFPKWRDDSISAFGNAIVPQLAFEFFKIIEKVDTEGEWIMNFEDRR
jgi:DNA (cytosine-5)-methyltransferase 1